MMMAPVIEVFSSIQGEGLFIGKRQIFIRFAGCNLDCKYCDTNKSKTISSGIKTSIKDLHAKVSDLITPDFHAISFTGGEPLLQADYIKKFHEMKDYPMLLETNGTLPNQVKKIAKFVDYASVDIKLPEHFEVGNHEDIISHEIESANILISRRAKVYCKAVVLPETKVETIVNISERIHNEIKDSSKISLIIQPSSPISEWGKHTQKLFKMSEIVGKNLDVRVIPQIHTILDIR